MIPIKTRTEKDLEFTSKLYCYASNIRSQRLLLLVEVKMSWILLNVPIFCRVHSLFSNTQHKEQKMISGRAFLNRHQQDTDDLFAQIVTDDETQIFDIKAESKQQSAISIHESKNDGYRFLEQKGLHFFLVHET